MSLIALPSRMAVTRTVCPALAFSSLYMSEIDAPCPTVMLAGRAFEAATTFVSASLTRETTLLKRVRESGIIAFLSA